MADKEYPVIKMQARCPVCRNNVNGVCKVNKFKFGHPHICPNCVQRIQENSNA